MPIYIEFHLLFQSGTTGLPKAAMLSHDAVIMNSLCVNAALCKQGKLAERVVSYLPLNHIAAQLFDVYLSLDKGSCVYFADRDALKGTLMKTFAKARPTCIFGVPRVYEKIQEQLTKVASKSSSLSRYTMDWARRVTLEHYLNKNGATYVFPQFLN